MIITSSNTLTPPLPLIHKVGSESWSAAGLLGQQRGNLSVEYRLVSLRYHDSNPNLLEGNVDGMESASAQEQNQVADRLKLYAANKF